MKKRLEAWGDAKVIPIVSCFIYNDSGLLLLLRRHTADLGGGQWGTVGGRIETDENPRAAIIREIKEETGLSSLDPELLGSHEVRMPHGAVNMTSYRATIPDNTLVTLDENEHHDYAWFNPENSLVEDNILWGIPTILHDFGLFQDFEIDPTLNDGSEVILLNRSN